MGCIERKKGIKQHIDLAYHSLVPTVGRVSNPKAIIQF